MRVSAGKPLNPWEMTENHNIVINSAKSIGCQVVNIHAKDLMHAAAEHRVRCHPDSQAASRCVGGAGILSARFDLADSEDPAPVTDFY